MTLKFVKEKPGAPEMTASGTEKALIAAASKNKKIVIVMSDLGSPALQWFRDNAPNRIIELGIAEGNAAVVSGGLASEGYEPFWSTFGFCLGRAYNQIRQCICVDRFNVKMLLRCGAIGTGGISHNYIEDIAAMRVIPNLVIVQPADVVEAEKMLLAIADYVGPVFYRMEMGPTPWRVFEDNYEFEIGKAIKVREGNDAAIIATGCMVTESLKAADLLQKEKINAQVINMSTIKPIDEEAIITAAKETGAIVTAENHSIIGGLGEAVSMVLSENLPTPMSRIGVRDEFSQSGITLPDGKDQLMIFLNLSAEDIAAAVKDTIKKKKKR